MAFAELVKIIGIAIITLVCYLIIKPVKPDIAIFILIVGGCLILLFCINAMNEVVSVISGIVEKTGINSNLFLIILKVIGVGYLVEFASNICNDAGCSSLSDKICFAGKICILVLSLPIITNLLNIIVEIL